MDLRLELVVLPVADVERALAFYAEQVGFHPDEDNRYPDGRHVVQLTPPGSACSIAFGSGLTDAPPGSVRGTHLVVRDIEVARSALVERGVEVEGIRHVEAGHVAPGTHPARRDHASFAGFADPDGNTWVLQEVGYDAGPAGTATAD